MVFLKPNSISGEIMTLFDEANEKVIIVSPYCKFDKWYKLVKKIKDLQSRNVEIEFFIRDNEPEAYHQVTELGIIPVCIPNLHAKLYLNESTAIVTSMNLLFSSEINSIDIGYKTNGKDEYAEIMDFYTTYLSKSRTPAKISSDWRDGLDKLLNIKFERVRIIEEENALRIKTRSNNYNVFIWNERNKSQLRLSGIVSGTEFDHAKTILNTLHTNALTFEIIEATKGYNTMWATLHNPLKSESINYLQAADEQSIIMGIADFISCVEDIKDYCYKNRNASEQN